MRFELVTHGSAKYQATVALRRKVLRLPLGLDLTASDLQLELDDIHLGAFDPQLVACLVLTPESRNKVKMRQVAVEPDRQRSGLGSALVRESERVAVEYGFRELVLHARDTAVPFYLRLGYEAVGAPFEEVTIPHQAMRKDLLG